MLLDSVAGAAVAAAFDIGHGRLVGQQTGLLTCQSAGQCGAAAFVQELFCVLAFYKKRDRRETEQ